MWAAKPITAHVLTGAQVARGSDSNRTGIINGHASVERINASNAILIAPKDAFLITALVGAPEEGENSDFLLTAYEVGISVKAGDSGNSTAEHLSRVSVAARLAQGSSVDSLLEVFDFYRELLPSLHGDRDAFTVRGRARNDGTGVLEMEKGLVLSYVRKHTSVLLVPSPRRVVWSAYHVSALCPLGYRGISPFAGIQIALPPFVTTGWYQNFSGALADDTRNGRQMCLRCPSLSSPSFVFGDTGCGPCPLHTYYSFFESATGVKTNTCKSCPLCKGTMLAGAMSPDQCISACPRGHFSPTGVTPCKKCKRGTYQDTCRQTGDAFELHVRVCLSCMCVCVCVCVCARARAC